MKLTESSIMKGVKKANIYGYHDRKDIGVKIKVSQLAKKEKAKEAFLRRNEVDIMEWRGANSDMRGFKNKLEYLGKSPHLWTKDEFNNKMGGGKAMNSGFAKGGDFNNFNTYKIEGFGKANINSKNTAPFHLRLDKGVQSVIDKGKKTKPKENKKTKVKFRKKM